MVHFEIKSSVAILRMADGRINLELLEALDRRLDEAEAKASAAVITGSGPLFAIGDLAPIMTGGAKYLRDFLPHLSTFLRRFFERPLPMVAAVNGSAVAAGCYMAAACDRRVMTNGRAQIGSTELETGLPILVSGLEILRQLLPGNHLHDVAYGRGRMLTPSEALAIGLVDQLAAPSEVVAQATEIAARLARIPKDTFALTRDQLRTPAFNRMDRYGMYDRTVVDIWSQPASLAALRKVAERLAAQRPAAVPSR